jgi:hypothetical protein
MGTRVVDPACSIRVGDKVRHKDADMRFLVIEVFLDGHAAWCEIDDGKQSGLLLIHNVRDLVKIGPLH